MKKMYQQPQAITILFHVEPLMGLSQNGHTLTFDESEITPDGDASTALSRNYSLWDDNNE
jgi:hypothetical protein